MAWTGSFEGLREYLRHFTNIGGDPAYDIHGVLMLLRALAANLHENDVGEDLRELATTLDRNEIALLSRLAM